MDNRQLQITRLLQSVVNIKEKYKDIFEVLWFDPQLSRTLCLTITLPPQFPNSPPVFRITPQVIHPWLDISSTVVGHKKCGPNWNQHVSLANMTNEIIKELQLNSPRLAPQHYPSVSMYNPMPQADAQRIYYGATQTQQPLNQPPPIPQPPIQSIRQGPMFNESRLVDKIDLNDLERMSNEELKSFLNDDNKCMEYIKNKENIKKMFEVQKEISENNKKLAENTLSYKEKFEMLKNQLIEQQNILKMEKSKFEELMNEQKKYVSNYSPEQIFECLQNETSKSDEASEEIANQFLSGDITAEEFLKQYKESRKLYHLRAEKLELLTINQKTIFSSVNH